MRILKTSLEKPVKFDLFSLWREVFEKKCVLLRKKYACTGNMKNKITTP